MVLVIINKKISFLCNMLKQNYSGFSLEAGTDEAGRGCLSGPVVAAAVILPLDFSHPFLNDSKQLSKKKKR
ncbi:MAG: Ribonuclease HII [Polaribacter sp. SA4-10]|nr:MAG: Ribonuclease HII [Polaribacter sp. SA4-10]